REQASLILSGPPSAVGIEPETFLTQLRRAFHAAMILTYAQGLALLAVAADSYEYQLNPETVARIWRGGCIIRAALLEDIREAYRRQPGLQNLLLDPAASRKLMANQEDLRRVVCAAAEAGLPAPGFMSALGYLDGYRSAWLPANLIQAQRDYFGAHTYERVDAKGTFHTEWGGGGAC
ncbi:MAG: NADP-dependent phosphogluconate dehydrogenase, partial [Acidobacteria bacterium]